MDRHIGCIRFFCCFKGSFGVFFGLLTLMMDKQGSLQKIPMSKYLPFHLTISAKSFAQFLISSQSRVS